MLSRLIFAIAVDVIVKYAKEGLINEMLYAGDLVLMKESMENLRDMFLKWEFESKGLKQMKWDGIDLF